MSRLFAVAVLMTLTGCVATKKDVRTLQEELAQTRQQQTVALREIQQQNSLLLDSIRTSLRLTVEGRGTTANQLRQFDQSVNQLGALVDQIMASLSRIEARLTALEQRPAAPAGMTGPGPSGGGEAEQYYQLGLQKLSEGSYTTARAAFQQLLSEFPDHEQAPSAQFQIGQSYYQEEEYDDAYAALEAVAERWPESARAPAALFRAGAIAEEQRSMQRARRYYEQVREDYPRSDEARQAERKLRSLPGR